MIETRIKTEINCKLIVDCKANLLVKNSRSRYKYQSNLSKNLLKCNVVVLQAFVVRNF